MYPTPYTVITYAAIVGVDADLNPIVTHDEGVVQPVIGWAPASSDIEPNEVGRSAVIRDVDLLVPPAFTVGPHDQVSVNGELFDVVGHPGDFTHGPFGFEPGKVVHLKRTEG